MLTVCVVDNIIYKNGDPIPTDDPCESCKCRPPGFSCVLRECEVKSGCKAIRREGHCCPQYKCGESIHVLLLFFSFQSLVLIKKANLFHGKGTKHVPSAHQKSLSRGFLIKISSLFVPLAMGSHLKYSFFKTRLTFKSIQSSWIS